MPAENTRVFISYSRKDSDFALRLGKDLKANRVNVWLDQLDIKPGDDWDSEIDKALENCVTFLLIMSPESIISENVKDELVYANEDGKKVVPVLYKECKIPRRLRRKQHSDFTGNYDKGFSDLLRAFDITDQTVEKEEEVERKPKPERQRLRKKEPEKVKPDVIKIVTDETENSFVDPRDGIIYRTVRIGDQIWMAENLRATKFNDGTDISLVTDGKTWRGLSSPAYCWYDNNESEYGSIYGALYNWHTLNAGKLCPAGWHVPSDDEWEKLNNHLGGTDIAASKLKEAGTKHWNSPNNRATNESGFTALPSGYRINDGAFSNLGYGVGWWGATEFDANTAWFRHAFYGDGKLVRTYRVMEGGLSVRCLKD